jgi:hypothetical protein
MSRITKAAAVTAAAGAVFAGSAGVATADAGSKGAAVHSPGVISGNVIQIPIEIPINICGNTIDIIGVLNPTFGNPCINADKEKHHHKHIKHGKHHHGGHHGKW